MNGKVALSAFRQSLADPPRDKSLPLQALWWAAKGDWNKAHAIAPNDESADAAWVHAYLHRVEGDSANARYWYAQAGRPPATAGIEAEWDTIVATLLGGAA